MKPNTLWAGAAFALVMAGCSGSADSSISVKSLLENKVKICDRLVLVRGYVAAKDKDDSGNSYRLVDERDSRWTVPVSVKERQSLPSLGDHPTVHAGAVCVFDSGGQQRIYFLTETSRTDLKTNVVTSRNIEPKPGSANLGVLLNTALQENEKAFAAELSKGFDAAAFNSYDGDLDETPLHTAALMGEREMVQMLLDSGAKADLRLSTRAKIAEATPLLYAVIGDHLDIASLLLAKGADPNAIDDTSETVLMRSVDRVDGANLQMVELLISKGGYVNFRNVYGSVLGASFHQKNARELIKLLRAHGARCAAVGPC